MGILSNRRRNTGRIPYMECKAVIFDLFETLITEWGHEKYTKKEMCADLGIDKPHFDFFWKEKEQERYIACKKALLFLLYPQFQDIPRVMLG